ncbi:hypothetical protein JL100_018815 [Skermanella mucosa]|uniref:hypothetical protein n=1 Tax=Skermanella mucosa TaxID=1789672 RepID=UPI00192A96E2|nr:hypothetical protein [Skermanella mucosa]UEM19138.1 hypothetical protein JL100_018815 [Skermanella mucosa]
MRIPTVLMVALALSLPASRGVLAQSPPADDTPIYGSQMMTQQERADHRNRMHQAKSAAEREQLRQEHHRQMQARAKERGVTLPDEPPPMPGHGGMGMGQGMGMGPGGGGGSRGGGPGGGSGGGSQ